MDIDQECKEAWRREYGDHGARFKGIIESLRQDIRSEELSYLFHKQENKQAALAALSKVEEQLRLAYGKNSIAEGEDDGY